MYRESSHPHAPHLSRPFLFIYRSSYLIIVLRTDGEDEKLPSALELLDYTASQQKKVNYYVTANMSAASVDWSAPFTVGDEKSFGDYENVKLKKEGTYAIYEMAAVSKVCIGLCVHVCIPIVQPENTRTSLTLHQVT